MNKKIRLLNYKDEPKEIIIKDFEKVKICIFEIKSGDGVLTVIYPTHQERFDSSEVRVIDFNDGTWVIEPKDIDVINEMKDHRDTDRLNEVMLEYGTQ